MSSTYDIPFNRPALVPGEVDAVEACLKGGKTSGDGPFTRLATQNLRRFFDEPERVLLTTSCTHALEMCAILLDIQPGDEVIVPSFTFVSTPLAFVSRGATPIFCDVRPDTLNLDERLLEDLITEKTRAIVPVHYAGIACEMDAILDIAERHDVSVIEDNAHGLFGRYQGKPLGTFGQFATQSFHETKNISCGEGGALVINDAQYAQRAEIIREKGTNRSRFFRGEIDKYTWVDLGSSYLPSDILAAALNAQLSHADSIQDRRRQIFEKYDSELEDWRSKIGALGPTIPEGCDPAWHMYYLLMPSLEIRSAFIDHMKSRSILTVFHYLPLHLSKMGTKFGGEVGQCPVTEDVADRLVRLPLFFDLQPNDLERVIETALEFEI